MAHDVFISYSHVDKAIADGICANLEAKDIRCWIAPRDIAPGLDWPTAIASAISTSRIMVLVFSASSNSSEDVGRELILAANSGLIIIPFKIDNITPIPGKQYYLARTHWLDAMNPPTQEQIDRLVGYARSFITVEAESGVPARPKPTAEVPTPRPVVAAKREGQPPRSKRAWRQWVVVAAALVLMVLAGGGFFVSRQAIQQRQATSTALAERSTGTEQAHSLFSTATEEALRQQSTGTEQAYRLQYSLTLQYYSQQRTVTAQARVMQSTATMQALLATTNFMDNEATRMYGPGSGSLLQGNYIRFNYSGVHLRDLIVEATFYNPYPVTSTDKWDYGFFFRDEYANNQLRLAILSNKMWELYDGQAGYLVGGNVNNLNTGADQSNSIKLWCDGNKGWLFVNGDFVAELDLSSRMTTGDVGVAEGMFTGDSVPGKYTQYDNFFVWKIP